MSEINIARALKDKQYFDSLTEDEKAQVRAAAGIGSSEIRDEDLDSVSGGAGGVIGIEIIADTTTTTDDSCSCDGDGCVCSCD